MIKEKKFQLAEQKAEKNKEQLLEEFKNSLEKYGVEDVECRLEKGKLVIEQKLGSGIRGLGYDKNAKSLWLCLDQSDSETIKENERWNANTVLDLKKEMLGINFEKISDENTKIRIAGDHPVATLARLLDREKVVCLPGRFNNWKLDNPFQVNEETGKLENEIEWDGKPVECKVAIDGIECGWQSGKWRDEAQQKLEAKLGE